MKTLGKLILAFLTISGAVVAFNILTEVLVCKSKRYYTSDED